MAKCNKCGEEIGFDPHPTREGKWLPVNKDKSIHKCKSDDYTPVDIDTTSDIKMKYKITGSGNSQTTRIVLSSANGLRVQTLKKRDNGFEEDEVMLEITGEWELETFVDLVNCIKT